MGLKLYNRFDFWSFRLTKAGVSTEKACLQE